MRVQLYLYDLSQGLANQLSLPLTGKHIRGIWHTSVVAFNRETYFGLGIAVEPPQTTPHGHLVEVIEMGETDVPEDVYWEFIDSLREVWTADKYHLFDNNCNTFSNEVCMFLVGKGIPDYIAGLPREFLETPFGRQVAPVIESMFGPSRINAEHRRQPELSSNPSVSQAQHPHSNLHLPNLKRMQKSPTLFSQSSDSALVFDKLKQWISDDEVHFDGVDGFACLDEIRQKLNDLGSGTSKLPSAWWNVFDKCFAKMKIEHIFPLVDILRQLVLQESLAGELVLSKPSKVMAVLSRISNQPADAKIPTALRIMSLRLISNLSANPKAIASALTMHEAIAETPHRTITTAFLIDALLCGDSAVRACASAAALNISLEAARGRPKDADPVYVDWCVELAAAIVEAVRSETQQNTGELVRSLFALELVNDLFSATALITALGHLLYFGPEEVSSMVSVLDCGPILKEKAEEFSSGDFAGLAKEICMLLV